MQPVQFASIHNYSHPHSRYRSNDFLKLSFCARRPVKSFTLKRLVMHRYETSTTQYKNALNCIAHHDRFETRSVDSRQDPFIFTGPSSSLDSHEEE